MLQVELAYVAKREHCVPFGLLDKARLRRDVKRDQLGYRAAAFPCYLLAGSLQLRQPSAERSIARPVRPAQPIAI